MAKSVVYGLHHYIAADDTQPRRWRLSGLRVSDVTTLISVATTLTRICTSITAASSGRCIFIPLEKTGLSLAAVQSIATWKVILWPATSGKRLGIWAPILALLLLLIFPQQLSTPVLSGAVDWNVIDTWGNAIRTLSGPSGAIALDWSSYTDDKVVREWYAKRASGYAGIAWGSGDHGNATAGAGVCRHIVDDNGFAAGSVLRNPVLSLHNHTQHHLGSLGYYGGRVAAWGKH
ncbi:hypothetical protein B0T25DRAFT_606852 [Lasiosphaeria hispida]|uniref:Uncharacterized protein n=1 Tax=Lasiosphaeria hispida TaxID=260671 RepID=A0AAJ0HHH9_9PEZI|nr:hypothetical protein B0T25DRAFT_606852 [Lasiosphaeria hispida]